MDHKHREAIELCGRELKERKWTMAMAESATAGRVASEFSMVRDAGSFLRGGVVCYDASLKESLLRVDPATINLYTPESMETTQEITHGLVPLIPADIHIGITGLTAPGGSESKEKPVGTMFLYGILHGRLLFEERCLFPGTPEDIILLTCGRIAATLYTSLRNL